MALTVEWITFLKSQSHSRKDNFCKRFDRYLNYIGFLYKNAHFFLTKISFKNHKSASRLFEGHWSTLCYRNKQYLNRQEILNAIKLWQKLQIIYICTENFHQWKPTIWDCSVIITPLTLHGNMVMVFGSRRTKSHLVSASDGTRNKNGIE